MGTQQKVLNHENTITALQRLELMLEPSSQEVIEELQAGGNLHLPQLSKKLKRSPYKVKKQLDQLKAAGFVFNSKQYPKAYSVNMIKCLNVVLRSRTLNLDDVK